MVSRRPLLALLSVLVVLGAGTAVAAHVSGSELLGHTTVDKTVVPLPPENPDDDYVELGEGPGEPYVVRDGAAPDEDDAIPNAQAGREQRRISLAYLSQMTDFQLADEESPARVEFVDPGPSSAWRPQEGLTAFQIDATIRQINAFAGASPVAQGDGSRAAMDFGLLTGDQADNQHFNETVWVRDLLEGNGPLSFNSGESDPAAYADPTGLSPACAAYVLQEGGAEGAAAEGARYTGVQDYDDYPVAPPLTPLYYDPDDPTGPTWENWPTYGGLLDRAQQIEIEPAGLDVPFYITNGNHDVLVQGNEDANAAFEDIATDCFKALATVNDPTTPPEGLDGPDPTALLSPADVGMLVAPDEGRRFVSKPEIKQIYGATDEGPADDDHGFALVDPAENEASNGSASYYAWDPEQTPGFRFISIDTNSEGGQTLEGVAAGSSNGNLDDPQFQWIKRELVAAKERNQLVVMFGHHPVRSLSTEIRDEQAAPCTTNDEHGHDVNPGCDLDPRLSDDDPATEGVGCIHNGTDEQANLCPDAQHESFVELIDQFPNVVAYIPGHTHEHRLTPFVRTDGTTWWEVNTSAVIDYPHQSRLVEFMDNRDGTLSIFNTVVDHAAAIATPADCPAEDPDCALDFDSDQLASIGRAFTYNDPDNDGSGDGRVKDRNAELLVEDPRPVADLSLGIVDAPDPVTAGDRLKYTFTVTNGGPGESQDTTLTATLPAAGPAAISASQGACTRDGRDLRCDLGALAPGASATVDFEFTPTGPGELTVTAAVRGNVRDMTPANDTDSETTTVLAAAKPTPTPTPGPSQPGAPGGPGAGGCTPANAFVRARVQPLGSELQFAFTRRPGAGVARIDVLRVTKRRRVKRARRVASFERRSSFAWSARRGVRNGFYTVRFTATDASGRKDVRRRAVRRRDGRWRGRPRFERHRGCGVIARYGLGRPVFGGSNRKPLAARLMLNRAARVRVVVLRGRKAVKRFAPQTLGAGEPHRDRWRAPRSLKRRTYRVRVTVRDGATRVRRTVRIRNL